MTKNLFRKLLAVLAPVLGAGAIGTCPLCWAGSASFLTYLGLGALIPWWRWVAFGFVALGTVGFILDYRTHKDYRPFVLLAGGAALLYLGRYVYGGEGFGGWQIWGMGSVFIITSVIYNRILFKKSKESASQWTMK